MLSDPDLERKCSTGGVVGSDFQVKNFEGVLILAWGRRTCLPPLASVPAFEEVAVVLQPSCCKLIGAGALVAMRKYCSLVCIIIVCALSRSVLCFSSRLSSPPHNGFCPNRRPKEDAFLSISYIYYEEGCASEGVFVALNKSKRGGKLLASISSTHRIDHRLTAGEMAWHSFLAS